MSRSIRKATGIPQTKKARGTKKAGAVKTATAKQAPTAKAATAKKAASAKRAPAQKAAARKAPGKKAAASQGEAKPNIWVTRDEADGSWALRRENRPRRLGSFRTQAEAKAAGRQRAERDGVELIWQGRDGQIAGRAHYGTDA